MASGAGSMGFAFNVKDEKNMFLFEITQVRNACRQTVYNISFLYFPSLNKQHTNGGFKRLLRIVNGAPTETARIDDGGFVEGQRYNITITKQMKRISIVVAEVTDAGVGAAAGPAAALLPATAAAAAGAAAAAQIDLIDGSFNSGSIGFFTSGVNSACFQKTTVKPLPCTGGDKSKELLLPPYPSVCSNYREAVSSFAAVLAAAATRCC